MSKKLNSLFSLAVTLAGLLFSSTPSAMAVNYMWNNTGTTWAGSSSWVGGAAPASNSTSTTDTAQFGSMTANFNSVYLASNRTVAGATFDAGANAYTFTTDAVTPLRLAIGLNGIANNSTATQTFNLGVDVTQATSTWQSVANGSLVFNNGIGLSTSGTSRILTVAGAGNFTVNQAIVNGGTATAGRVTVTATGTTTFSGNNTYDGLTTMSAAGGTLILSGNNSGAAGGVTLTAGTLNLNNANALGTGTLELAATTGTSYGSTIINNTSGGALTYLGLSGVVWTGVSPAGIQFGTSASTSLNNMDFGTGLVTAATDRSMNIAGTGVTISMGILTASGTSSSYTYKIDGAGNTLDLDGWRISGAATPTQAAQHKINATANVNIGAIENGTGAYANGVVFNNDGVTRLTGNNTYTGATEFIGSGTTIISGNNSAAVGSVKIAGDTGKLPVVRLDHINAISSSSSLIGSSSSAQIGTLDLRAAGNFSLNSYGTATTAGNNMIFINSSGSQKTLAFTAANNYITVGSSGGRTLYNNSANLLVDFDGDVEIGGTLVNDTTFAGVGNFNVDGNLLDTGVGGVRTLRKTGDGTLTLRGSANSYRGSTLVSGGTLEVGAAGALPSASSITVSSGATLKFNQASGGINMGPMTVAGNLEQNLVTITSSGAVDLTGSTLKVNGTPTLTSYTLITGTTSLAGTPTLSPAISGYSLSISGNNLLLVKAPSNLSYASINGTVATAITSVNPTVTGTPTSYSISPALPAGLSLNTTTGVISGTPSVAAASSTYTVTATNAGGSTTTTLTIKIVSPAFTLTITRVGVAQYSSPNTTVTHDFIGVPNQTYLIEYSTDLVNWTSVGNQNTGVTGSFSVTITKSGNVASDWNRHMFFRARLVW